MKRGTKQYLVAALGLVVIIFGLFLVSNVIYASGVIFAPKQNEVFWGQYNYMYADFNPNSATITSTGSQTYIITLYDVSGIQLPDDQYSFVWLIDGSQIASGGANLISYTFTGIGIGSHSIECDISGYGMYGWDYVSCYATLTVTPVNPTSTPSPYPFATPTPYPFATPTPHPFATPTPAPIAFNPIPVPSDPTQQILMVVFGLLAMVVGSMAVLFRKLI